MIDSFGSYLRWRSQTYSAPPPPIETSEDLARFLSIDSESLASLTNVSEPFSKNYRSAAIPKRSGGVRLLAIPREPLLKVQRVVQRNILRRVYPHKAAMAYRFKRSITNNASPHKNRDIVVRIDIADFFTSIGFDQVKLQFSMCGYSEQVSEKLAIICTAPPFRSDPLAGRIELRRLRHLPQGAPSSPLLSNLVCIPVDRDLSSVLSFSTYTRYADDLFFSWDLGADDLDGYSHITRVLGITTQILENHNFTINRSKLRVMRRGQRQIVTGLLVNDSLLRVPRRDIRRLRALLHNIEHDGAAQVSVHLNRDAIQVAEGLLSYVHSINPQQSRSFYETYQWIRRPADYARGS
jgi:retron-type reverse transcriptase